jgi:hypothetical protein
MMSLLKRMRGNTVVTLNTLMVNFFGAIQKKRIALSQWGGANILKRRQRALQHGILHWKIYAADVALRH